LIVLNYEIHLLTNGNVLDDINKIYKGIKIVPNGSNSVIEFSGTAGIVATSVLSFCTFQAPTTLPDPAVFLTPPVLLVFEGTGFCLSIIL
jgi:hypothetical protein